MKISTAIAITATILATGIPAEAATKTGKDAAVAQREASCKAQAAKKFSAVRFMARKDYVDKCMGRTVAGKKQKPAATTGSGANSNPATPNSTGSRPAIPGQVPAPASPPSR